MDGIVLLAHGARDAKWAEPFASIARQMRELAPQRPVTLAFLELMLPDLLTAAAQLAAAGCTRITVVPLFLGAGGHVREDVPRLVAQAARQLPAVHVTCTLAIGESEHVTRAIAAAALTLAGCDPTPR
jgi:sirohydrochlorin cobaltochelatase